MGLRKVLQHSRYRSLFIVEALTSNLFGGDFSNETLSSKNKLCLYDFASLQNSFFGSMNRTWVSRFTFTSLSGWPLTPPQIQSSWAPPGSCTTASSGSKPCSSSQGTCTHSTRGRPASRMPRAPGLADLQMAKR